MTTIISSKSCSTLSVVILIVRGFQNANTNADVDSEFKSFKTLDSKLRVAKAIFLDPRFERLDFGIEENEKSAEK